MAQHADGPKKIFFYEDDSLDAIRIKDVLGRPPGNPSDPVLKVFHYNRALHALKAIQEGDCPLPDAALLDVHEVRYTGAGIDICEKIREFWPSVPVMFLSEKYELQDRIRGRKVGAVTYMPKKPLHDNEPDYEEEILASIYALLGMKGTDGPPNIYQIKSLSVDVNAYEVRWRGEKLQLTASEIGIVDELASPGNVGRTRRYESLADAGGMSGKLWTEDRLRRNVRQRVRLIRKAFEKVDKGFTVACKEERHGIIAVDKVGYRWIPDGDQSEGQLVSMRDDGESEHNG